MKPSKRALNPSRYWKFFNEGLRWNFSIIEKYLEALNSTASFFLSQMEENESAAYHLKCKRFVLYYLRASGTAKIKSTLLTFQIKHSWGDLRCRERARLKIFVYIWAVYTLAVVFCLQFVSEKSGMNGIQKQKLCKKI